MEWYMEMCEYGCGSESKYKLKNGRYSCSEYSTQCPANKNKNSIGLKNAYREGKIQSVFASNEQHRINSILSRIANIKSNPFETWGRKLQLAEINDQQNHSCLVCGISEWQGKKITLELDHIDGNSSNNVRDNLRLLCPNCHSQTDTWRGRNINSGIIKVTDEELIDALSKTSNIRTALIRVKLSPKGANYARAKKLLEKMKQS